MKLSYLLLFGILAYIVSRMSNAYTVMAKELRELRIKCVGEKESKDTNAVDALPILNDIKKASTVLQGLANRFA